MAVGFRGVTLIAPGVASYIDDSKAASAATFTPNAVAVVGEADRGQPGVAVAFTDASAVNAFYGPSTASKSLTDGLVRALASGSSVVYGVRVGRAKPFTASLYGATTLAQAISLVTKEYGRFCKAWSITVGPSTKTFNPNGVSIGQKISLKIHDGSTYITDNIGRSVIALLSTTANAGSVSVTNTTVTLTTSTNSVYVYKYTDYPRLQNLVAAINQDGAFMASVSTGTSDQFFTSSIDYISGGVIPASTGTPYYLVSTSAEIVSAINYGILSSFLTATLVSSESSIVPGVTQFSYKTSSNGASFTGTINNLATPTAAAGRYLTVTKMSGAISALASTSTSFTVTHPFGLIPLGTSVNISGCVTTGFNATWTVASSTPATTSPVAAGTITVSSTLGTTTLAVPSSGSLGELSINGGGIIVPNMTISGTGVPIGTVIASPFSATGTGSGGIGTYLLNVAGSSESTSTANVTSVAMLGSSTVGTIADYDPEITASDWTDAFVALQTVPASLVVPMTSQESYHATALAHAQSMSLPTGRSERIVVCGGSLGETYLQAQARAAALNDKRAVLVWPGIKDFDANQFLVTLPPYYLAAQIAGLLCAQEDEATPLTNSLIQLYGIESVSSNKIIDSLVSNGVFTVRNDLGRGFVVVQGLTTWTGDMKMARREISTVRAADAVMRTVRNEVQRYVGAKSSSALVSTIESTVRNVLDRCADRGLIYADPANPARYPAYGNIVVKTFGDAYYIDFNISPAKPVNYLLITAYVS